MTKAFGAASATFRQLRQPRWRALLLVFAVLGYAYVSLEPFEWSPPRLVGNGATWTDASTLELASEGLAASPRPPDWLASAVRHHQLVIDLRVRPATLSQWGHVLTIGEHGRRQNLSIAQKNRHLILRLRRTCHHVESLELACTTSRIVRRAVEPGQWMDLELIVQPGGLTLSLDGDVVVERALSEAPLAVWEAGQQVALGNDVDGGWPWLGEIERAVVRTPDVQADLLDPRLYRMPATYWAFDRDPHFVPFRDAPLEDMVHNSVMYFPFGVLLALLGLWPRWQGVIRAFLIAGAVSLTMETAQLFFSGREPSITDLLLNATGGAFGFALIQAIRTDPRISRLIARITRPRLRPREQEG